MYLVLSYIISLLSELYQLLLLILICNKLNCLSYFFFFALLDQSLIDCL